MVESGPPSSVFATSLAAISLPRVRSRAVSTRGEDGEGRAAVPKSDSLNEGTWERSRKKRMDGRDCKQGEQDGSSLGSRILVWCVLVVMARLVAVARWEARGTDDSGLATGASQWQLGPRQEGLGQRFGLLSFPRFSFRLSGPQLHLAGSDARTLTC